MEYRVLFVDDDPNILAGYKRQLRKQFHIETAEGSVGGLEAIKNNDPFAVIVSDLRMPEMDGNQFLSRAKKLSPESVRIMLTGYADLSSAIEAINHGNIFRLLTKPCAKEALIQALNNGIDQFKKNIRNIPAGENGSDTLPGGKILIVDDDPGTLRLLQKAFKRNENLEIFTAGEGKSAINLLNNNDIDLIITDLRMPGINGLQLLAYVNKKFPGTRVIVLTGFGTPVIEEKVKAMGDYQYYEKPLDFHVLMEAASMEMRIAPSSQIHGINIASFLQLIDIEGKLCTLKISSRGKTGFLYFRSGELIAAETDGIKGEEAARNIINWENSVIEVKDVCKKHKREIEKPLMHILMESARIKDEKEMSGEI